MGMQAKLPRRKVVQFFMADIAKGFFNGMIGNYLVLMYQPEANSSMPIMLPILQYVSVMAILTSISKVVDAITDPLVANYSDKCRSSKGRRMPFMRISAIPYALSVLMVFFAPFNYTLEGGRIANAIWVGVFLILYYCFYTLYFIPQRALVPEIIPDPKQRVGYYGISTAFFMGTSAIMYMAPAMVKGLMNAGLPILWAWRTIFVIFSIIGCACLLLSAFAFNEKDYVLNSAPPTDSIWKAFGTVLKNKNFVIFSVADLMSYVSMAFFQTAMMYYVTMLINLQMEQAPIIMGSAIVTALVLFPIIIKIGKKNKRTPLIVANAMFTVLFFIIYFGNDIAALMPGKELVIGVMMGIAVAYPFAAINILPQAVLSDIIQADSLETGVNREGIYSAIKTFMEKIAYAIALAVVSSLLLVGSTNGKASMQGVKLTGVVAGCFALGATIFFAIFNEKRVIKMIYDGREKAEAVEDANVVETAASDTMNEVGEEPSDANVEDAPINDEYVNNDRDIDDNKE